MKVRACVVDDERLAREGLANLLAGDPEVEVVAVCASGRAAITAIRDLKPDVVFLDVRMPKVDGFAVIREIGVDAMPLIVFTTAFDSHAVEAFESHAIEYLLKPFSDERFETALRRVKKALNEEKLADVGKNLLGMLETRSKNASTDAGGTDRILVRDRGKTTLIRVGDIDWIEGADYYAKIHVAGRRHMIRESLTSLAARLGSTKFFHAHRSAIVNIDRIREIQTSFGHESVLLLSDGTKVRLARGKRAMLEKLLEGTAQPLNER
jgi:two-component system LytT family response regulator